MATSRSTDLAAMPGIRLAKISRPIDRERESRWLPLSLTHRLLRPDYVNVCYHNICTAIDPLTHFGYDTKTALELEHDLVLLAATFGIADASAFAHQAAPKPGTRGQALVTFDDGHRQWLDEALPVLKGQDVRPIMFVVSGTLENTMLLPAHCASFVIHQLVMADDDLREQRVASARSLLQLPMQTALPDVCAALRAAGYHERQAVLLKLLEQWGVDLSAWLASNRPYLDEDRLRELASAGCVLGAHSVDHRSLHALPFEQVSRQVLDSCARIRDISGQRVVPFAFPFSRRVAAEPLAQLREREPWIGAYFGTGGLRAAPSGFYERIVADWRLTLGPRQQPDAILMLIRRAYLAKVAGLLRRGDYH